MLTSFHIGPTLLTQSVFLRLRAQYLPTHRVRHRTNYNEKSKSNLGRDSSPPLTAENNYATKSPLVTVGCPTFTPITAPSLRRSPPHLYTHPSTDPTHHPNGIEIQSAVLPQYTLRTDRETDRQIALNDKSVPTAANG